MPKWLRWGKYFAGAVLLWQARILWKRFFPQYKPHFYVQGNQLFDTLSYPVVLRGVNKMSVFDNDDPHGAISFKYIHDVTRANTVRIVWAITKNLSPGGPATNSNDLDSLITNAISNKLVPMIELHDGTGDWSRLNELVTYWTQPQIVSIIQKHQKYLLVNIGNEVGNDTVSDNDFISGYTDAIQRMRAAGIHTPLVIDAPDWGKNLATLNNTAATLLNADPDRNLIFSVHLYWSMSCGADANFIKTMLANAVQKNYALIVGEFSQYGGFPCNNPQASICSAGGETDYKTILAECHKHRIGWYAWEWGPGNGFNDPLCSVMDMTSDRINLKLGGWAEEVALTSPYSIKNTSMKASTK